MTVTADPEDALSPDDRDWLNYTAVGMCPETPDGEHIFRRDSDDDHGSFVHCDCGKQPF